MRKLFAMAMAAAMLGAASATAAPTVDCSTGPIFAGPAQGFFNNVPFLAEGASADAPYDNSQARTEMDVYHVVLNSRDGMILDLMLATLKGNKLDGRTFAVGPHHPAVDVSPGVHEIQTWTVSDQAHHFKTLYFSANDASMQLVFGTRHGGEIPLKLHFCVPSKRTEVAGQIKMLQN